MLIQVISLLTEESWHTGITLPTIIYNIPADSIFKQKLSYFSSNGSSIERKNKKIKTENSFQRDYSLCHWGGQMQLWSQYFLTAPTLMANKQLGIPPPPSLKQIAIYIYLSPLAGCQSLWRLCTTSMLSESWPSGKLAGSLPSRSVSSGRTSPWSTWVWAGTILGDSLPVLSGKWPIPLLHPQELLSESGSQQSFSVLWQTEALFIT